jgi:nitrate/nitrite transporter NarK
MNKSFWQAGHTPTLFAAFFYFDLSFMVWVLLGPLGPQIAGDLHLSAEGFNGRHAHAGGCRFPLDHGHTG